VADVLQGLRPDSLPFYANATVSTGLRPAAVLPVPVVPSPDELTLVVVAVAAPVTEVVAVAVALVT
jgi:hypothetical protein